MQRQTFRTFTAEENRTWRTLFENLETCRASQAVSLFADGVKKLGFTADRVPDLDQVNQRLAKLTGWKGVAVEGLEDNSSFFRGLANKEFPIGNFIRDSRDVNYTPAPDVFHDLYGHMPFFADAAYAEFCEEFGKRASKLAGNAQAMDLWGRLFWFGVEFPLVETPKGRRIFGGGILSSYGESNFALSDEPEVLPFDIRVILERSYKIDEFQKTLFCLRSTDELYSCLPAYERLVNKKITSHAA